MSWELKKIEDFGNVYGGGTPSTKDESLWNGDISWISPKDLSGYEFKYISNGERFITKEGLEKSSTRLLPENTILFTSRAPIGYVAIAENPICTNQGFQSIVCKEGISDHQFVFYLLKNNIHIFYNNASGATFPEISNKKVKQIQLLLPPLKTQKRIASILSTYDDLIENNLKRIKLLEETAQNIYKEWFVNFRFPDYEHTEFDAESGLPLGWKKLELNNVADVLSSKRVFLSDYVESGIPFYRGKEITQKSNFSEISELYYISQEKFLELESKSGSPNIGDILITGVGTIGNSYLVNEFDEKFYFKDGNLLWIKNIDEKISSEYLIQYFKSIEFSGVVNSISIGSSQKALTINALKSIKIIVPEEKLIVDFSNNIKVVLKQINLLFEQLKKLKEARDILLPRLMNRTIEV